MAILTHFIQTIDNIVSLVDLRFGLYLSLPFAIMLQIQYPTFNPTLILLIPGQMAHDGSIRIRLYLLYLSCTLLIYFF